MLRPALLRCLTCLSIWGMKGMGVATMRIVEMTVSLTARLCPGGAQVALLIRSLSIVAHIQTLKYNSVSACVNNGNLMNERKDKPACWRSSAAPRARAKRERARSRLADVPHKRAPT